MLSCDNFALSRAFYSENRNLLAKNSDRPLGESQPMQFFSAASHEPGELLQCTHLTIPQAEHTYAVLGCQPYWIWGFEMGVNEFGLAIGNEAQGSRCEVEMKDGLLGMDLLRLGLERGKNAREAMEVITAFLSQYGQSANASQLFERRYENSFLLVDREEIWILETAGRQWAARQVNDYTAISNCYSIETEYDLCSEQMESYARQHRWVLPQQPVDFARAYTKPDVRQSNSTHRWRRMKKLLRARIANGPLDDEAVQSILRDHYEGELIEPRFGASYGTFVSICMHAMSWDASQTTASFLVSWHEILGVRCLYAPSIPCCSVYLPVYWTGRLPEAMTRGGAVYDETSLWWRVERLAMAISIDEARFGKTARTALGTLETEIRRQTEETERQACRIAALGEDPFALLQELTEQSVQKLMNLSQRLTDEICAAVKADGGLYGLRKEFIEEYCERTELSLT